MVYLNNAADTWPKAPDVADAVKQAIDTVPEEPGRSAEGGHSLALDECRTELAKLLGTPLCDRIALTHSATHALNFALLGAVPSQAKRVITTVMEHNSVLRPVQHLKDRYSLQVDIVGLDSSGELDVEEYEKALDGEKALVALTHVSNVTGRINNAQDLFEKARSAGHLTLLDAAQSLGKIPVSDTGADIIAFPAHKGTYGPSGIGGLYVASSIELEQIIVGGTGVRSDLARHPPEMPTRLESGTPNIPATSGWLTALRWLGQYGQEQRKNMAAAASECFERLRLYPEIKLFSKLEDSALTGIIAFCVPGWSVEEAGYALQKSFQIICRSGLHCAPLLHKAMPGAEHGTIRFSFSGFNTLEEARQAAEAVGFLYENRRGN